MQNLWPMGIYEKIRPKNKVVILDKKSYFDSYYEKLWVKSIVAKYTYAIKQR